MDETIKTLKSLLSIFSIAFYSLRKWLFRKYTGPTLGPVILFVFSAIILYLYILFIHYLVFVKYKVFPSEIRNIYFENLPLIKGFLLINLGYITLGSLIVFYVIFCTYLFWIPRSRKDKIGLGIAISMDKINAKDIPETIRRKKETISELKNVLLQHKLSNKFRIKKFNDYQTNRIYEDILLEKRYYKKIIKKSNLRFIIYGHPKRGYFDNKERYKHDYEYIISHADIPIITSIGLSRDMRGTLKAQPWTFDVENIGTMIETTANNIEQDVLFSLGASSILSNRPDIGIYFLEELRNRNGSVLFNSKINKYLAIAYRSKSIQIFNNQNNILEAIRELEKSISLKEHYDSYILMSFLRFRNGEIKEALKATDSASAHASFDHIWKFNKAFLLFYSGDKKEIEEGIEVYKGIKNSMIENINAKAFEQIIGTFKEMIDNNKFQYFYGLIFVYFKLDRKEEAKEMFHIFKQQCGGKELDYLVKEAQEIINRV